MDRKNLLEATCSGLREKPEIYYTSGLFSRHKKEASSGYSIGAIIFIVLVMLVDNIVLIIMLKNFILNKINEKMRSEDIDEKIQSVLNNYSTLDERSKL
jgi:hypothetical protein